MALYKDVPAVEFDAELALIPQVPVVVSNSKAVRRRPSAMPKIKFSNITQRTNMEKLFPLVIIDTETTGLSLQNDEVVEISAIKYDVGFQAVSCYTSLIRPQGKISQAASDVNHITNNMVKNSPSFSMIAKDFEKYIAGCNIAGHNLVFDLKFLYVQGINLKENRKYFDTLDLSKKVLSVKGEKKFDHHAKRYFTVSNYDVENRKLDTLCKYYGIHRSVAHRSLSDCFATGKLFERLIADKLSRSKGKTNVTRGNKAIKWTIGGFLNSCETKERRTTFFLCLFLGWLGIHRLYTGKIITGIIWMFSFALFGIGWIFDIFMIMTGRYRNKAGMILK